VFSIGRKSRLAASPLPAYQRFPKLLNLRVREPIWIQKVLVSFVRVQSNIMMCLPVERSHSWAKSLVTELRGSHVEEAIDLDLEALQVYPSGYPKQMICL